MFTALRVVASKRTGRSDMDQKTDSPAAGYRLDTVRQPRQPRCGGMGQKSGMPKTRRGPYTVMVQQKPRLATLRACFVNGCRSGRSPASSLAHTLEVSASV